MHLYLASQLGTSKKHLGFIPKLDLKYRLVETCKCPHPPYNAVFEYYFDGDVFFHYGTVETPLSTLFLSPEFRLGLTPSDEDIAEAMAVTFIGDWRYL